MNGITVLAKNKLDFDAVYREILKTCSKTTYENNAMIYGKSIHKWYFYNLPDLSNEIFEPDDLVKINNEQMFCYELSFRNNKCSINILNAIKSVDSNAIIFDDNLDGFIEIEKYIEYIININ